MNWQMVSALSGMMALVGAFVWHLIRYAYDQGKTHQRLTEIETTQAAHDALPSVVSALNATVRALDESVKRMDGSISQIFSHALDDARLANSRR